MSDLFGFPADDYDPFADTPDVAVRPRTDEHVHLDREELREQLLQVKPKANALPADRLHDASVLYRTRGYDCFRVEKWASVGGAWHREDLFGFGDVLCIARSPLAPMVLLQVTSRDHMGDRVRKMCSPAKEQRKGEPVMVEALRIWLRAGHRVVVLGWHQPGGRGSKWACEEREVTLATIAEVERRRRKTA